MTKKDMIDSINQSGYLIERRVFKSFLKHKFKTIPNPIFFDNETNKRREIDLISTKIGKYYDENVRFVYEIICECENNHTPIVFFPHEFEKRSFIDNIKFSGFDVLGDYLSINYDLENLKERSLATQYCGFRKKKKSSKSEKDQWIANHMPEQHDTISKIKKAIQHRRERFESLKHPSSLIYFKVHLGLIVMRDELYMWDEKEAEGQIKPINRVTYVVQDFDDMESKHDRYYVDVIREDYIDDYLIQIEKEVDSYFETINDNQNEILEKLKDIGTIKYI